MKQHFAHFLSPGTFVHEETVKPIEEWDKEKAMSMSRNVKERHGAKPFAFYFSTRERGDEDLDSSQIETSHRHFLGGEVLTKEEVLAGNCPEESILRENVRMNDIPRILFNKNSYLSTHVLNEDDEILAFQPQGD